MEIKLVTGKQFNSFYADQVFVKLTTKSENHNGYQFLTGLNIDNIPFHPEGECTPGGIYFCLMEKMPLWLNYGHEPIIYARLVKIPNDAQVWVEDDKFKADQIILEERQKTVDLEIWKDPKYCLQAVKQNGYALQFVKEQTVEMCLAAVQYGWALRFVKEQTPEICLAAVKQSGNAFQFVKEQTVDICLAAVKQNGLALQDVKEQTAEICLAAVQQNGCALQYVNEQTMKICLAAVQQNGYALKFVDEQTVEICLVAVQQNGRALESVKEQTAEICLAAVQQNGRALKYVQEKTAEIQIAADQQLVKQGLMYNWSH